MLAPGERSAWTYYFRVADIDRTAGKITAQGGQVLHGPAEVPGGDFIVIGTDAEGATCAFVGAKSNA